SRRRVDAHSDQAAEHQIADSPPLEIGGDRRDGILPARFRATDLNVRLALLDGCDAGRDDRPVTLAARELTHCACGWRSRDRDRLRRSLDDRSAAASNNA